MRVTGVTAAPLLALLALAPASAHAEEGGRPGPAGLLSLLFENDTFASTDRYYTSGLRASWQSLRPPRERLTGVRRPFTPWLLPRDAPLRWGLALGQSIYTSRRNTRRNPPPDDRPYAGWLYGTLALSAASPGSYGTVELSLGVIGPASGAKQLQNSIHDLFGSGETGGWGRQLGNRFAILLALERRWQWSRPLAGGLEVGVVPALGAHLGTVQTSAASGLLLRVGRGLAMDFGPPRIRPALSGLGVFRPPDGLAGYLFAGVEGRAVAYDGTLEGHDDGYWDVDRTPLVAELPFGAVVAFRRLRLAATGVVQTRTFDSQGSAPFVFGSVALSLLF